MSNKVALVLLILGLLLIPISVMSFESTPFDLFSNVFPKHKVEESLPRKMSPDSNGDIIWTVASPQTEEDFSNLRTTYIKGIYCQQVDDDGLYRHQKHYFYNKKTEKLVEIPNMYYINDVNQLGEYKDEYKKYAEKSDTITHKGKKYKIPTFF